MLTIVLLFLVLVFLPTLTLFAWSLCLAASRRLTRPQDHLIRPYQRRRPRVTLRR